MEQLSYVHAPVVPPQGSDLLSMVRDQQPNRVLWERIETIDLNRVACKVKLECGWTDEQVQLGLIGYRLFLYLSSVHRSKAITPFYFVDMVWHNHILESMDKYSRDCMQALGFVPDHRFKLPNDPASPNGVHMADLVNWSFGVFKAGDTGSEGCDGHTTCEFDDGQ